MLELKAIPIPSETPLKSLNYACESISPMFMHRHSGQPELRTSSIKGMLRFWWRALHPYLSLQALKERETAIFGGATDHQSDTGKRSLIQLELKDVQTSAYPISLTPHHRKNKNNHCHHCGLRCGDKGKNSKKDKNQDVTICTKFTPKQGYKYKFTLQLEFEPEKLKQAGLTPEQLDALVNLTFALGGFGQRSRRGFGAVRLDKQVKEIQESSRNIDLKQLHYWINKLSPEVFQLNSSDIHRIAQDRYCYFPCIESIQLQTTTITAVEDTLIKIGAASSAAKSLKINDGWLPRRKNANQNKMASPLYISLISPATHGLSMVITKLRPVYVDKEKYSNWESEFLRNL